MTVSAALSKAIQQFKYARKKRRHDRIVRNIRICYAPTQVQAIALLPIATWRAATTIIPARFFANAIVGLALILLFPRLMQWLLGQ